MKTLSAYPGISEDTRVHRGVLRQTHARENLYKRLLEHTNEAVWAGDKDEKTIYVNPAFIKLTGYSHEECLRMHSYDFFDKKDREALEKEFAKRKKNISSQYETTLVTKNGEQIPVLGNGAPTGDSGTIGILTDMREVKKREEHKMHLAAILENSIDAIVSIDLHKRILVWNNGAEHLFGYKAPEILEKSISTIIPPQLIEEGEIDRMRAETNARGFIKNFKTIRLAKDGRKIPVSISQSAIRDEKGDIVGYSAVYRDISDQKRFEEELQIHFEKIQSAYQEMGRQRRYLDYLQELLDIMLGKNSYGDLGTYIVNAFLMIAQVDAVTIRTWDAKKQCLSLRAVSGLGQDWWGKKIVSLEGTLHGEAIKLRKPLKVSDIWSEPLYPSPGLARKYNLKSCLIIPLFYGNEILGTVALYVKKDNPLDLLDNEFITIFAKEVAVAMKLADKK